MSTGNVRHKTSDFTPASLAREFAGQELVISTIAGCNYHLQATIIDAAIAAGVRRFIPHEFGYDTLNEKVQARSSKGTDRAKVIEYLRHAHKTNTSFEWVAVAVGCVLDTMLLTGDLGFDMEWQSGTIPGSGEEVFPATSLKRVGTVVESIIQHWDAVKNQFVYAASLLTSGNEIAAALERMSSSKWSVGYSDVDDCVREGESRIDRGFPDSGMFLLERSVLYDERLGATDPFRYRSVNELLGLKPEEVDSVARTAYHEFRHRGKPACGCSS